LILNLLKISRQHHFLIKSKKIFYLKIIKYPVHSQDVTSAISWEYTTIYQYGGDPDYISIMGHSAGTGIVASIGTNKSFLEEHELCFDIIRHVICLDTAAYDIRNRCEMGSMLYLNAFGTDPVIWDAASPLNNIETEEGLPSFFVVVQGSQRRIDQNIRFVEKVNQTETKT
jgi:acetyl esterase/lipase